MAYYRLTEAAKEALRRIYRYGVLQFGEAQADKYFDVLFERFELIAAYPSLYPSVDYIRALKMHDIHSNKDMASDVPSASLL